MLPSPEDGRRPFSPCWPPFGCKQMWEQVMTSKLGGPSNCSTRVTLEARPSGSSCRLKPVAIKVMLTCMEKTMWIRIFQQIPNDKSKFHFPELKAFSRKSQDIGVVFCILGILYWNKLKTYLPTQWRVYDSAKYQISIWINKVVYNFGRSIYLKQQKYM